VRRIVRPIIVDVIVFAVIISALFLGFLGLKALAAVGYSPQRIETFETIHYWSYACAFALFAIDLIFKIFLALFFRNKERAA
jgi:hypothetical protein